MKTKLYCVHDWKSGLFSKPVHDHDDNIAIRNFVSAVSAAEGALAEYPEDFGLYRVGEFDDETGMFEPESPYSLMSGLEAVRKGRERIEKLEALQREIEEMKDA